MGTRHDVLTEAELATYQAPGLLLRHLREHAARVGRRLRVLEWGCGRGRLLALLLEEGFDAYGCDVDTGPLRNGRDLFAKRGWEPERRMLCWQPGEPLPFPDGFFDVLVSDQVLEHVGPLDAVLAEMARLTAPDGQGIHRFPSHRRLHEPHLGMPLVHWLPKNGIRRAAIRLFVALGVHARWPELGPCSGAETARRYHAYSVDHTWYRPPRALRAALRRHGLEARFRGAGGRSRLLYAAARLRPLRPLASRWRLTFHASWMFVRPAGARS